MLLDTQITQGNTVEVLINGKEIFPKMLKAMESATSNIHLISYVFTGKVARKFVDVLCAKAEEGVECRLVVDAVGSWNLELSLIRRMRKSGVEVVKFRPPQVSHLRQVDHRTHLKLLIVDGLTGFIGDANISDKYDGNAHDSKHYRDNHVCIKGPCLQKMQEIFCNVWEEARDEHLHLQPKYFPDHKTITNGVNIQFSYISPVNGLLQDCNLLTNAITKAEKRLWMCYGLYDPPHQYIDALMEASQRGVDVKLLVSGEYAFMKMLRWSGQSTYEKLLTNGIQIYEYQRSKLHAKLMVGDDWVILGSSNFDTRSYQINDEMNVIMYSQQICDRFSQLFLWDIEDARQVSIDTWLQRPYISRLREGLSSRARAVL